MLAKLIEKDGIECLQITLPVSKRPSGTGKTTIVASTNGNKQTSVEIDGKHVVIGVNAYIK